MSEFGGPEIGAPDEGGGGASEALSEEARQRFAAAAAAQKAAQKDERKAKKRDDGIARMILQFLTDDQRTHLATLIARLVGRDCPSVFLLSILSLINADCRKAVTDYLAEREGAAEDAEIAAAPGGEIAMGEPEFLPWIDRMQRVLRYEHEAVLRSLMVDAMNIDGTVLQLTTFVIQEFLREQGKEAHFERIQNLTVGILQSTFQPYLEVMQQQMLAQEAGKAEDEE